MTEPTNIAPLALKLACILQEVGAIDKNGSNDFHGYAYHTEADLTSRLSALFARHKVAFFPSVVEHSSEMIEAKVGRNTKMVERATVTVEIMYIDGESGATLSQRFVGKADASDDKAYYKAYTGAIKYALLKTFMISDKTDPEFDHPSETREPEQQAQQGQQARGRPQSKKAAARDEQIPEDEMCQYSRFDGIIGDAVVPGVANAFKKNYVKLMNARRLDDIDENKVSKMCDKLEAMSDQARLDYIKQHSK